MSDSRQRDPRAVWYHWRMHDDFDACYRAVASRDARFDGRFFTGVTSTGIYCRPVCPARTPGRRNVRFFACAAAAEESGFRACRRCRPETAPEAPGWDVRADLVGRALRLIREGVVDDEGVRGLAARVAVSERHLHRLFIAELGAAPLAVARTRRAQVARRLLDDTDLPVTDVAFSAGYASVRQFNDSLRAAYGATPSELRRSGSAGTAGPAALSFRLRVSEPFDGAALLGFLGPRAIPGVEEVAGGRYRRTVPAGIIEVDLTGDGTSTAVRLRARLPDSRHLAGVVRVVRDLCDLDTDPAAAGALLREDPVLAPLVAARPGLRVPGTADRFELAVRAVLGQQVSVSRATHLAERLVQRHGERLDAPDGGLTHRFPTPAALAAADLSGLGVPGARARAVQALAHAVADGALRLDGPGARAETVERLLDLPGIGPWTAGYIAMRALRDPDALPVGDLGLRRALAAAGTDDPLAERATRWRPWRAYAALQLWTADAAARPAAA